MSILFTCRTVEDDRHEPLYYEILSPDGQVIAEVIKFEHVENLLRYLNGKITMTFVM